MITFASREMIPYLKEMWKICFNDEESYINLYFDKRFSEDDMLVLLIEGKPVSMLSLLPAVLIIKNLELKKINYIYAVATLPEYRRNGYCKKLIEHALEIINLKNEAAILLPASSKLRKYYRSTGFTDAFNLLKRNINIQTHSIRSMENQEDIFEICDITPEEYKKLRDICFYKEGYVCWDINAIEYAIEETVFCGGYCKKIIYKNKEYAALYYIENNKKLYIKEITATDLQAESLCKRLAIYYGCSEADLSLEALKDNESSGYAMVSKELLGYKFSYFNLSLG